MEPVGDPLRHLGAEPLVVLAPLPQVQRQLPQLREGQAPPIPAVEIYARRRELWISQASLNWAFNAPNVRWPACALKRNPTAGIVKE